MAHYEADTENFLDDSWEDDTLLSMSDDEAYQTNDDSRHVNQAAAIDNNITFSDAEDAEDAEDGESDYSIDYEYRGPRNPNYRLQNDNDSDASDLSDTEPSSGFDMWDEDPYSTNDYTWETNDMRLTLFVKKQNNELELINATAPWQGSSFWRKQKGWPQQLPFSSSTTNHDQSANAMCLVQSNYGLAEQLYTVYRDRIVECGREPGSHRPMKYNPIVHEKQSTTWIDSDPLMCAPSTPASASSSQQMVKQILPSQSQLRSQLQPLPQSQPQSQPQLPRQSQPPPSQSQPQLQSLSSSSPPSLLSSTSSTLSTSSPSSSPSSSLSQINSSPSNPHLKFHQTHLAVSLPRTAPYATSACTSTSISELPQPCTSKFVPFTKYIKRSDFPPIFREDAYMTLGFEPLCLAQNYGYMAIGGIDGECELYCCMDDERPIKIWGTKFKGKDKVMLMTNAVQIVRWKKMQTDDMQEYEYMLIACMNEAGILVYRLPSHQQCQNLHTQYMHQSLAPSTVHLHSHLRYFDRVPINDAQVSPDGKKMVCVGDVSLVFMVDIMRDDRSGVVSFGTPSKLVIPEKLLRTSSDASGTPYSSQYVAWSKSSHYFAHTSDSHTNVFVWRAATREILYSIDAAGYAYAIKFHPLFEGVLAFTNRYGYFHTVNLDEATPRDMCKASSVLHFDRQTTSSRGHVCQRCCIVPNDGSNHAVYHTQHLSARHEITMVAFRGEKDRTLRILAKINGIQWSKDGRHLYVATKKRVLAYQFLSACTLRTLMDVASQGAREVLEHSIPSRKRKRYTHSEEDQNTTKRLETWHRKWLCVPAHIRHKVLGDFQLASHW
ncbi:hypothetical protein DFQ28_010000 [Apophysomyces sp. BC1034]|nr:hypothetical protein DFQ30_009658 [Apophysomyces sp. BC1015]KAG0172144.1 hypothetical protein DFQ29_008523 [Apophysomyces sp. BC1021]KAG0185059.1 hypothetical protein DFQ28_010000 [Apophysomyces sp. BC1034]